MLDSLPMLIDVSRLAGRLMDGKHPTGVDRVSLAYLRHYRERARALVRHRGRWLRLGDEASRKVFAALLGESGMPQRTVRLNVAQAHLLRGSSCRGWTLLNTGHSGLDDPGYAYAVRRFRLRPVYFLHDLIPLTHPEYSRPQEDDKHHQRLATMLDTGSCLIFNSGATRQDLVDYVARYGSSLPPHVVAPLGIEPLPTPGAEALLPEPYFVMLGTIEPRKNHLLILHVWRRFAELGETPPKLVLIGQRGWECEQVIDLLERSPALRGSVIELPRCNDTELATWLRHARALLFPSFVEGFGLPLIEAVSQGTPVLAADLPVFRESVGEIPEYLDPLDGPAWLDAVRAYSVAADPRRRTQLERLRGYQRWDWGAHFAIVDPFLERCRAI